MSERPLAGSYFSVRSQTLLLSAVPLVFLFALLAVAMTLIQQNERANAVGEETSRIIVLIDRVDRLFSNANSGITAYGRTHRTADLAPSDEMRGEMPAVLRELDAATAVDASLHQPELAFSRLSMEGRTVVGRYVALLRAHRTVEARAIADAQSTKALGSALVAGRAQLQEAANGRARLLFATQRDAIAELTRLLVALTVFAVLVSMTLAVALGLRFVRRLQQLGSNARRIAVDERTEPLGGNDELAELDRVYREMTERMSESVRQREAALAAYEQEHQIASTLQRALLPDRLPALPGLRIDTAYAPAGHDAAIGGDWYDVFPLEGNAVGISIGDVAGHGLRAATMMGEMRQSIRTAARTVTGPAQVLRAVNRGLCADEQSVFVTAFFGVFDSDARTLRYALAGHPPPIVVTGATVRQTMTGDGLLLGLDPDAAFSEHAVTLAIGDGIVLFTDGIVEIDRDYLAGIRQLEAAVEAEVRDPSGNLATGIARRVFGTRSSRDDAAVLYVGVTSLDVDATATSTRTWHLDARDRSMVQRTKTELMHQLDAGGGTAAEYGFVEVIFGELLGNVARHTSGRAVVTLEQCDGKATLHVDDEGPPFGFDGRTLPKLTSESGRGLYLVRALARSVGVERRADGNRVSAVLPLPQRRPAVLDGSRSEIVEPIL